MSSRKRLLCWTAGFADGLLAYEGLTSVVAYTADAYVRSDLIAVAPEVAGRIIAVHVRDNQAVRRGDPLLDIDPEPFQLMAGVWVCGHVNQSRRGIGYIGVQASVALIVTMMQGWTPPLSPLPVIARLAGMLGGLALLLTVLLATWPAATQTGSKRASL